MIEDLVILLVGLAMYGGPSMGYGVGYCLQKASVVAPVIPAITDWMITEDGLDDIVTEDGFQIPLD